MNPIVVGVIDRYNWRRIAPWYRSLVLTGFAGEIHLLTYRVDAQTLLHVKNAGIEAHHCSLNGEQLVMRRFKDLADLLTSFDEQAWVIFPDVGDLVFQLDPTVFLDGVDRPIVCASEGVTFAGNRWARQNLLDSFPECYDELKDELLMNAGSIAARAGIFSQLAAEIHAMCRTRPDARCHDQAAFNILVRGPYREHVLGTTANGGWCYCGASSLFAQAADRDAYREALPEIRDGRCYVMGNRLSCMFHHYNRDPQVKQDVERWVETAWLERRKRRLMGREAVH